MICPDCNGTCKMDAFFVMRALEDGSTRCTIHETLPCCRCEGSGHVANEMSAWIKQGKNIKKGRIGRKIGLSKEAKRLGIKPSYLSQIESGRINNSNFSY